MQTQNAIYFLDKVIKENKKEFTPFDDLYMAYGGFCILKKLQKVSEPAFHNLIMKKFCIQNAITDYGYKYFYEGIGYKVNPFALVLNVGRNLINKKRRKDGLIRH